MGNMYLLFSMFFLIVFVTYCSFGIYILHNNSKGNINRIFFALCLSLSIWSFGFVFAISAVDLKSCLFWRQVSAIGWGSMYSILLHFILILTDKKKYLDKRWIKPIIYFPAMVTIYAFAIPSEISRARYHMIKTSLGWINIAENNAWDWFFYVYYISYMIIVLATVWNWGRGSSNTKIKKQSRLIIFSFLIAFAAGSITDIFGSYFLSLRMPQVAPIIIIFPIAALYYSIKKHGLIEINKTNEYELILNDINRLKFYKYLSYIFYSGASLNIIVTYLFLDNSEFKSAIITSILIFSFGFVIQIIQRVKMAEQQKDILNLIVVSLCIPFFTLKFMDIGSVTVWSFSFIFIIISLIFNQRKVLYTIVISTILTQVHLWISRPNVIVEISGKDYFARIGIIGIVTWVAYHINKIYIDRLKQNSEQIMTQKLIADISSDFVAVNQFNYDKKINNLLKTCGEFFKIDRACICMHNYEEKIMKCNYEWCNEGIAPQIGTINHISNDLFQHRMNKISNNEIVYVQNLDGQFKNGNEDAENSSKDNIKSLLAIPIAGKGEALGEISFNSINEIKIWRDDQINHIKIIGNILMDALIKVDAEKKIGEMAYYDQLTKLPNRLLFKERIDNAISMSSQTDKMIGVIFLDLDSFKSVNDTLGHEAGDKLLKEVAKRISKTVRESDTVARFGGDEFLVMLEDMSKYNDIVKVTSKIMDEVNQPINILGQEFFITISVGIAIYPLDGHDSETLIKNADIAMYTAKEKGKNQYALCTTYMKDDVHEKMRLSNYLQSALENDEFVVYYQPQVNIQTKKIIGFEALLRWKHPELGIVPPDIFIPLAEKTGLINSIGEWVLKTACGQNKSWQKMGLAHVPMAVNISVFQFRDANFLNQIKKILTETDLEAKYLELEITESIAIKENKYFINVLNKLKEIDISISIDDFGTEYSSLSRLKMLPIDRIKMDIYFIRGIEKSEKDRAIVKTIINLAKNLGINVIAEGVETELQFEFLKYNHCDEVQGYYCHKPMTSNDVEKVLRI